MQNENEDHVLEIEVDRIRDQNVVDHVQDIEVGHILDLGVTHTQDMIEDLHIVIDQDAVDHQCRVMEVPENIKANVIVLPVLMNQEVLSIVIDVNI